MNKHEHYFILHCHLLELDDVPVGRLVALGDSEGLIEGLVLVAGTSMLSSVTAGSLSMHGVHCISISHREVVGASSSLQTSWCIYHFSDSWHLSWGWSQLWKNRLAIKKMYNIQVDHSRSHITSGTGSAYTEQLAPITAIFAGLGTICWKNPLSPMECYCEYLH